MKNIQQVLDRIDSEIRSLNKILKDTDMETQFRCVNKGALEAYNEMRRFITDDKWVSK